MWKTLTAAGCHVLAVVLIVVFCGYAASNREQEVGGEKFTGELEPNAIIRVLENDTAIEQGYMDALLAAFNEKYAEHGIKAVDAKMDQYLDLEKDGPYGYGPDVLYQANDMLMKYVDGRHIQPLPIEQLECYGEIAASGWDAYKAEAGGETFYCGVPVNVQGPLLYYRKDLLPANWQQDWDDDRNGVPDMVENWNDLYRYSKQVVAESEGVKFGYMKSLFDVYFASGYLFSYGGYVFGDNNTNPRDVGFSKGEAEKGASIVRQLASVMNKECIDDTITRNAYSKLAKGTYFATMTTPDVHSLFIKELVLEYRAQGMTEEQAKAAAAENLVTTGVPKLPSSGDLSEEDPELMPCKMMGGVNGYAVSSYTKYPNASLAFVNFATGYEMVMKRVDMLGIVPARQDAADEIGGLTELINASLRSGEIVVMPSVRAVAQIWTPAETFFSDVAKDAFRKPNEVKFDTLSKLKEGLKKVDQQIYDAIYTLQ